ncbi:putative GTP-binding protein MMR1 [Pseudoloma neurophilia]|uniref:Guanine nucleotide-binding protein-like 1 n=1 Tax=Pseudoloma neurophilia TaxID=146866 RepID=A0A0R0LTN3_9MICR|nr:putative GTP-binding protein MMR1 [Pseudoloma neurophilia]
MKKKSKSVSATSFLAKEIILKRFGKIPSTKHTRGSVKIDKIFFKHENKIKQNFDSCVTTRMRDEVVGQFILDQANTPLQKYQTDLDSKTIQRNDMASFPPIFSSELQFLSWSNYTKLDKNNETIIHFERNPLTWLQFNISVKKAECLVNLIDFREIDFYFEKDILSFGKPIICLVGKIDLCDEPENICSFLEYLNNGFQLNSNVHINDIQSMFRNNPKYTNFVSTATTLSQQGILFFPFSSVLTNLNYKLLDFLTNSAFKSFAIIGYPNIGKSTFLKYLTKNEKIKISAKPGKTKYVQEYKIDKEDIIHANDIFSDKITSKLEKSAVSKDFPSDKFKINEKENFTQNEDIGIPKTAIFSNKTFYDIPGLVFKRHSLVLLYFNNVINIDQIKMEYNVRLWLLKLILERINLSKIFHFYKITNFNINQKKPENKKQNSVNLKQAFYKQQRELLFGPDKPVEEEKNIFNSIEEVSQVTNTSDPSIILEKLQNTVKKLKHWTIEMFFRKTIKDLFDGKLQRDNY